MKFGDVLRELLEEKGLTQKQLAFELKLLAPTIGRYIRNEREPDFETLKMIASYFNVSTDYLLSFYSNKTCTQKEDEILRIFNHLSTEQQELFIEQGRAFIRINNKKMAKSS